MITEVRLRNITCFEDVTLDLRSEGTDKPAPWVVLLGENGAGKSTILRMIGASIVPKDFLYIVSGLMNWNSLIRIPTSGKNITSGHIYSKISLSGLDYQKLSPGNHDRNYEVNIKTDIAFNKNETLPTVELTNIDQHSYSFVSGYDLGSRTMNNSIPPPRTRQDDESDPKHYGAYPLFGFNYLLTDLNDWLTRLYFRAYFPAMSGDQKLSKIERYERAKNAILGILPNVTEIRISEDREVIFEHYGILVTHEQLSDGYRGMLAWIVDLVRRLFDAFPDSPDPLKERGVVLLDEIDLHLHPRWQRSVVETIRKTFPNLQFIVTTHSPFIVQDMRPEDKIIILERENGDENAPVVARHEPGAVHDWTADQILSSFFGLPQGTRGEEAQKAYRRYERLLDAQAAGTLTAKQRTEMQRLKERLDAVPLGDTPDEQELFAAADTVLDALRRRRKALERARSNANGRNGSNSNGDASAS